MMKAEESDLPRHSWHPDVSCSDPAQDELDRREFAKEVAAGVREWNGSESLVLSLNGEWGSGKTTLANFVVHYLQDAPTSSNGEVPLVVRFNPWQWSAQDKIVVGFFDEITAVFKLDKGPDDERLAKLWNSLKVATIAGWQHT